MTDVQGNGNTPAPPPRAVIQIVWGQDNTIRIEGPLDDKILFAGLLDVARERMFQHHRQLDAKRATIIPIRKMP